MKNYEKEFHFRKPIFQEDYASVHKAKIVNRFFKEEEREVLEWWANRSELNPIESLWAIVRQKLRKPIEI